MIEFEKLFFKVWRFNILKNHILSFIKEQTIEFPDHLRYLGNRKDYNSITTLEWLISKGQYEILKDKLLSGHNVLMNKSMIKKLIKSCKDHQVFEILFYKRKQDIEIIDLMEESVKCGSVISLITFKRLYGLDKTPYSKRLVDIAIGNGQIKMVDYLLKNCENQGYTESALFKNCLFSQNRDKMLNYIQVELGVNILDQMKKYPDQSSFPLFNDISFLKSNETKVLFLMKGYHSKIKSNLFYLKVDQERFDLVDQSSCDHLKYRILLQERDPIEYKKLIEILGNLSTKSQILDQFKYQLSSFYISHYFTSNYSVYKEFIQEIGGIKFEVIFSFYQMTFENYSLDGLNDLYELFLKHPDEFNKTIYYNKEEYSMVSNFNTSVTQVVTFFKQLFILEKSNFYIFWDYLFKSLFNHSFETWESLLEIEDFRLSFSNFCNSDPKQTFELILKQSEFNEKYIDLFFSFIKIDKLSFMDFKFNYQSLGGDLNKLLNQDNEYDDYGSTSCDGNENNIILMKQGILILNYILKYFQSPEIFLNLFTSIIPQFLPTSLSISIYSRLNIKKINQFFKSFKQDFSIDYYLFNYNGGIESYLFNFNLLNSIFNGNGKEIINSILNITNTQQQDKESISRLSDYSNINELLSYIISNGLLKSFSFTLYFNIIEKSIENQLKPNYIIEMIELLFLDSNYNIFLIHKVYELSLKKSCYSVFKYLYENMYFQFEKLNVLDYYFNNFQTLKETFRTSEIIIPMDQVFSNYQSSLKKQQREHFQFFIKNNEPIDILKKGHFNEFLNHYLEKQQQHQQTTIHSFYQEIEIIIENGTLDQFKLFYEKLLVTTVDKKTENKTILSKSINNYRFDIIDYLITQIGYTDSTKQLLSDSIHLIISNGDYPSMEILFKNHKQLFYNDKKQQLSKQIQQPQPQQQLLSSFFISTLSISNGYLNIFKLCLNHFYNCQEEEKEFDNNDNNNLIISKLFDNQLINFIISKGFYNFIKYIYHLNLNLFDSIEFKNIEIPYNGNINNKYSDKLIDLIITINNKQNYQQQQQQQQQQSILNNKKQKLIN